MKERRETSFHLIIIAQVQTEKQYEESMFSVRILVSGMTKRIVLEEISGKTLNLVRFAHNLSRASRSCDWNVGRLE